MHLDLMRDEVREFPIIEKPHRYTSLKIWHCNYRSFAPLADFVNLKNLQVATWPDEDFKVLSKLVKIQKLEVMHFPRVTSIRPLGRLTNLRELNLEVLASWHYTKKTTVVESFKPLGNLKELRKLSLNLVLPADGDLRVLLRCPKLTTLRTSNQFTIDQIAWLKGRCPKLKGNFVDAIATHGNDFPCPKCGTPKVELTGVPQYNFKCPQCQKKRVQKHLDEWNACVTRARRYAR